MEAAGRDSSSIFCDSGLKRRLRIGNQRSQVFFHVILKSPKEGNKGRKFERSLI